MNKKANKVYNFLKKVPKNKVTTYKELAKVSGLHPRVVGIIMKNNKNTLSIPCYKVVRSDGKVGGYSGKGGVKRKIELLKKDGIEVKNGKIDLKRYIYMFSKS